MPDGTASVVTRLGLPTDTPIVGDWNGDGQSDVGVWSPLSHRTFYPVVRHGQADDVRVRQAGARCRSSGDWDGDGRDDVGVFDPATSTFRLRDRLGNFSTKVFGTPASLPVAGDWDGDGRDDVGVYDRPRRRSAWRCRT